ncbi:MBL fold metallo-hydrolase [Oceanobacillus kapialis]|uniref:MBL fold metallo-hydrolase n=1 Tax=Oceanobacillus kapialis TaxID=481353 RepID=A0ABW5PV87_9BACI
MDKNEGQQEHHQFIPMTSITSGGGIQVKEDVYYYTDQIVNIGFIGHPDSDEWVLVDAGLPRSAPEIKSVVVHRFGRNSKPAAIILTHAHFDHVGGLHDLIQEWDVPVYAHEQELPYLQGKKDYPEPDKTVEGGMLAKMSFLYPHEAINLGDAVQPLPEDHQVPFLDDWKWVHTPGHSPGHVSFFREKDSLLLSGDAVITVRQDSFYKVLLQQAEVNGPPRYLTTDWQAAWDSARRLADLKPSVMISSHGSLMEGDKLTKGLERLVQDFEKLAVPDYGKYVDKGKLH